ncbi:acyl-CoA dehydrogenase family protein [Novipirellula rosea]|uniref:Acyl-CoA dehydrogenase n=1 Tax=Novipirellula rosea TaxID=1031540 RepID=A0ABP8NCE2_9BACT
MSLDIHPSEPTKPNSSAAKSDSKSNAKPDAAQPKADAKPSSESFAEVALRLGGASVDESKRTGLIDTADDQVEDLFAAQYKTTNSPVHRAVWDKQVPTELFEVDAMSQNESVSLVVEQSLKIVRKHRDGGTLLDDKGKITAKVLAELGSVGYWGLLVSPEFGGSGATMRQFAEMITQMATIDPTVAGLASVHGCIGAVDPVRSFGTDEQKKRFLPQLADGRRLSAFALTEPGAGSDLTALRTTAVLDGDDYVVNGEKLFITNAIPGRTIGLVCKIDGKPSVLVVDLPDDENEHFRLKRYGIYALRRANNNGLIFQDFRVPKDNLLVPSQGDGLTIAYHGLNLGRVSLCANAAGAMRWMLAEMLPWGAYRETYGQSIDRRELVRRRIGRLAGLIVACDAMTAWCADLLDQGYRGEMECIVAKIFGSEAQKEAAIELFMKTHGGRSFLEGHLFGDNVHEFLAPCIYEGEGEMLGMAFFKSLVKHHGKLFFEPIGRTLSELGTSQPNPLNPRHAWALRKPLSSYAKWWVGHQVSAARWSPLPMSDAKLAGHTKFAQRYLSQSGMRISTTMRTFQLKLADRQCRMSALSLDIQNAVVMLVTSLYAKASNDPITRAAADTVCRELQLKISGGKASNADFRQVTDLGNQIAEQGWSELDGVTSGEIMMPYK